MFFFSHAVVAVYFVFLQISFLGECLIKLPNSGTPSEEEVGAPLSHVARVVG